MVLAFWNFKIIVLRYQWNFRPHATLIQNLVNPLNVPALVFNALSTANVIAKNITFYKQSSIIAFDFPLSSTQKSIWFHAGILFLFFFLKKVFSGGSMPQLYEDHSTKQVERSAMEVSPLLSMNGPRGKSYSHQAIVLHNPAESVIQTKIEWWWNGSYLHT